MAVRRSPRPSALSAWAGTKLRTGRGQGSAGSSSAPSSWGEGVRIAQQRKAKPCREEPGAIRT